jgi:hypothetical protein
MLQTEEPKIFRVYISTKSSPAQSSAEDLQRSACGVTFIIKQASKKKKQLDSADSAMDSTGNDRATGRRGTRLLPAGVNLQRAQPETTSTMEGVVGPPDRGGVWWWSGDVARMFNGRQLLPNLARLASMFPNTSLAERFERLRSFLSFCHFKGEEGPQDMSVIRSVVDLASYERFLQDRPKFIEEGYVGELEYGIEIEMDSGLGSGSGSGSKKKRKPSGSKKRKTRWTHVKQKQSGDARAVVS